ncbi:MAG: hypothetical protein ACLQFX_03025 [Acidimicrobiales bacterium]
MYPCQRFACTLTSANAWLGATVDRYSFDVELFHLLLHAGNKYDGVAQKRALVGHFVEATTGLPA